MSDQLTFCSVCGGVATNSSRCEKHKSAGRVRSAYDKWYGLAAWKTLRGMKLRHDPLCEICFIKPATDVHHTDDSWKTSGNWRLFITLELLQSLCHECHSRITMERNNQ
jgi:hypothetical protein